MALQVAQPQAQQWFSARDSEVAATDFGLFHNLEELVNSVQLQVHPEKEPRQGFTLSAVRDVNPGGVFIHIGGYRPEREDRIWVRLLREHIGNGGPQVKPLGQLNGYSPVQVTEAQMDVLVRALELMEHKAALNAAMAAGGDMNNMMVLLQQQQPQPQLEEGPFVVMPWALQEQQEEGGFVMMMPDVLLPALFDGVDDDEEGMDEGEDGVLVNDME